eukprot:scaffold1051_cov119-Cylindrotheca_fusiformis.AAC.18
MTAAITHSESRSPLRFLKEIFDPQVLKKRTTLDKSKKKKKTKREVTFSDHGPLVVPTSAFLTEEDEDMLWWTDEELDIIMSEAQTSGELEGFKESIRMAQHQIRKVLQEQERQRKSGSLSADWKSTAKVSRKGSSDAQRMARSHGIEAATAVGSDACSSDTNATTPKKKSYSMSVPPILSKCRPKVGPT